MSSTSPLGSSSRARDGFHAEVGVAAQLPELLGGFPTAICGAPRQAPGRPPPRSGQRARRAWAAAMRASPTPPFFAAPGVGHLFSLLRTNSSCSGPLGLAASNARIRTGLASAVRNDTSCSLSLRPRPGRCCAARSAASASISASRSRVLDATSAASFSVGVHRLIAPPGAPEFTTAIGAGCTVAPRLFRALTFNAIAYRSATSSALARRPWPASRRCRWRPARCPCEGFVSVDASSRAARRRTAATPAGAMPTTVPGLRPRLVPRHRIGKRRPGHAGAVCAAWRAIGNDDHVFGI